MIWTFLSFDEENIGQAELRCPDFWQWKQSPFSMHHFCLSGVSLATLMMSISMASRSQFLVVDDWENEV